MFNFVKAKFFVYIPYLVLFRGFKLKHTIYKELSYLTKKSKSRLFNLANTHQGQRVFCLGNGPSLAKEDLSILNDEIVILTNSAFTLLDKFTPKVSYLVFTDYDRYLESYDSLSEKLKQNLICSINTFDERVDTKKYKDCIFLLPQTKIFIDYQNKEIRRKASYHSGFTVNLLTKPIHTGYSVIFSAIQIATYLGSNEIVCLGIDMNLNKTSHNHFLTTVKPLMLDFDYFKHAKQNFALHKNHLQMRNISLVNASKESIEDVLERRLLTDYQ